MSSRLRHMARIGTVSKAASKVGAAANPARYWRAVITTQAMKAMMKSNSSTANMAPGPAARGKGAPRVKRQLPTPHPLVGPSARGWAGVGRRICG